MIDTKLVSLSISYIHADTSFTDIKSSYSKIKLQTLKVD